MFNYCGSCILHRWFIHIILSTGLLFHLVYCMCVCVGGGGGGDVEEGKNYSLHTEINNFNAVLFLPTLAFFYGNLAQTQSTAPPPPPHTHTEPVLQDKMSLVFNPGHRLVSYSFLPCCRTLFLHKVIADLGMHSLHCEETSRTKWSTGTFRYSSALPCRVINQRKDLCHTHVLFAYTCTFCTHGSQCKLQNWHYHGHSFASLPFLRVMLKPLLFFMKLFDFAWFLSLLSSVCVCNTMCTWLSKWRKRSVQVQQSALTFPGKVCLWLSWSILHCQKGWSCCRDSGTSAYTTENAISDSITKIWT